MTKIKQNGVDAHGRNKKQVGGFSRVAIEMQNSPAFQSLSSSALRVFLWALILNFKKATSAGASGKPKFKFTNAEAKSKLGMNSTTFSRSKEELNKKGFMEWAKRGGLKGCNGVASLYSLSGDWTDWSPPPRNENSNLIKARNAKKRLANK